MSTTPARFHGPIIFTAAVFLLSLRLSSPLLRADTATTPATEPPSSWIDPDTGHRVIRMTKEPGSVSAYFNDNAYTPDGKEMEYTTPAGISVLNLATLEAHQVVAGPARAIVVGRKTPTVFYSKRGDGGTVTLWSANLDTGEARKLADLPKRASVSTVNADETLAAGTFIEGDATVPGNRYAGAPGMAGPSESQNRLQPLNKTQMMAERLASKLPMSLYTVDLRTGKVTILLEHKTDWLNHLQFSPTDPTLLMYCHEGAWHQVDRIWTIRTDGTTNQLVHKRIMEMEIAGHEWWDADGKTIRYQVDFPRDEPYGGFVSSYNTDTGERVWLHNATDSVSIHCNSSNDASLFCGDGDFKCPWIFLLTPVRVKDDHTVGTGLIKGGYMKSERLVNMSKHEYHLEPNPSFTPDRKMIVFASNMFGPSYVFEVEVAKAKTP